MRLLSSSSVHLPPSGSRTTQELGAEWGGGERHPSRSAPCRWDCCLTTGLPRERQARSPAAGDSWPSAAGVPSPWPLPPPASLPRFRTVTQPSRHRLTSYITPERVQTEKLQDGRVTANAF